MRTLVKQSSHFLQAHALLNLHVIHSAQAPTNGIVQESTGETTRTTPNRQDGATQQPRLSLAPGTETAFRIHSSLPTHPHVSTAFSADGTPEAPQFHADFTALQLLRVMNRLAQPGARSLSYFMLCREFGHRAVDGMVRGRILDLRWTEPVTRESISDGRISTRISTQVRQSVRDQFAAGSSATAVNDPYMMGLESDEGGMEPMTDEEVLRARMLDEQGAEEEEDVVGPKIMPVTPIMRYAMREVVQEYYDDDDHTVSEYASLSEVEEY